MRKYGWKILLGFCVITIVCIGLYFLPPIHQRLSWRIASLQSQIFYFLNPPDQIALKPENIVKAGVQSTVDALVESAYRTQTAAAPSPTITPSPTIEQTPAGPTATNTLAPTPTPSPTPLPAKVALSGIQHQWQSFNNCGPANLAMALSFWGWEGDQRVTKAALRPNEDDANVMPEEIVRYVTENTTLRALARYGGSLERLKQLTAAGFPVILEMGHQPSKDWWMGHYVVISGYDDAYSSLISQDSLIMPDLPIPYHEIEERWWRDFNHIYLVIYPPEREIELLALLGADADPAENLRLTLQATEAEISNLSERDLFFALFNQGAEQLAMGRAEEAASTFDLAFAQYALLKDEQRPWRVLWYRTEAYQAYHQVGRYQSVIDLANATLSMLNKRGLEESHFWRGMAYEGLGEREKAILDYQHALEIRPTYAAAQEALQRLGSE